MVEYRLGTHEDNLLTVLPPEVVACGWNPESMLLAVEENVVVGVIIFWDSGHPALFIEHLNASRAGVMKGLFAALEEYARSIGKIMLLGYGDDPRVLRLLHRWGVRAYSTPHYLLSKVL